MNGETTERTSIRSTPGGVVTGILQAGTIIAFTQEGNWAKLGGSRTGYVNMRSVRIIAEPPPPPPVPSTKVVHTLLIDEQGRISLDGLPYE
jgi:hypothetical protein